MRDRAARAFEADLLHGFLEQLAVLGLVNRFARGADQLDAEFLQHALARQIERGVETGLPAHGRQNRIRAFSLDDLRHRLPGDRLYIGSVGHLRIGHDGRRIRIHQNHAIAFLAQRLTRLRAGVIELARLADDDRAGADDENTLDVGSFWHYGIYVGCALRTDPKINGAWDAPYAYSLAILEPC